MNDYFKINNNDHEVVINFKKEANLALASITNSFDKIATERLYSKTLLVLNTIYNIAGITDEEVRQIVNTISTIRKNNLLSPLTLQDDEFDDKLKTFRINNRYPYIWKDLRGTIFNNNAFNVYIRALYSHTEEIQYKFNPELILQNNRIYISKGGIITGEYIENCIIPKKVIDNKCFTIQSVINIPVCKIIDNDLNKFIYVVDHREPKLKVLQEFYEVPICFDEDVKNRKYNIRKYKKIK